jgi:GNAT superfamily N-acetyltransferase
MQQLAQVVWTADPGRINTGASVGELAWSWDAGSVLHATEWRHRLWFDGDRTAAWGWISAAEMIRVADDRWALSATSLVWQVHPDHPELLDEVLEWFDDEAGGANRCTTARAADRGAIERLGRHGYLLDPGAPWSQLNRRPLRELEAPVLPAGFWLRTAAEVAPAAAVAVERAAWHPSQFTLESLLNVRSTWPYRDDLAVFVEAPDGTLVASALVWYDEINRTAELEPVGTDPGYRRLGLGRAVSVFGSHQARAIGATDAIVSCRGDENYPVPRRLYGSIGFGELTRDVVFAKEPSFGTLDLPRRVDVLHDDRCHARE